MSCEYFAYLLIILFSLQISVILFEVITFEFGCVFTVHFTCLSVHLGEFNYWCLVSFNAICQ